MKWYTKKEKKKKKKGGGGMMTRWKIQQENTQSCWRCRNVPLSQCGLPPEGAVRGNDLQQAYKHVHILFCFDLYSSDNFVSAGLVIYILWKNTQAPEIMTVMHTKHRPILQWSDTVHRGQIIKQELVF